MSEDIKNIRVCVDKIVPLELAAKAEKIAIEENPDNAPNVNKAANEKMALLTQSMWKNGRTLRVHFLDGHPQARKKVKHYAQLWSDHANIKFDFVNDPKAEIRISFVADPGSWSAVGTDALVTGWFPPGAPTMNFGWLTPETDNEEYSRVVIHEFGHALGCIHEHQGPSANIKWNKPVVYRYFKETQGWTEEDVDHNLFDRYSEEITQFTKFDPKSIMIYEIPPEFTLDGKSYPTNVELSETDIMFIKKQYPKP
jgi:serralysin